MSRHISMKRTLGSLFLLALLSPAPAVASDGNGPVPLTLWNVQVRPGHPYLIQIRTCRPRGIRQGQILIRRIERPVLIERAHVFSDANDGVIDIVGSDEAGVQTLFSSPEAAINERHGPFLAMLVKREQGLVPGEVQDLAVIASSTELWDENLELSPFVTLDASLTVIERDAPFLLEVTGLEKASIIKTRGDDEVVVAIGTRELLRLSHLEFELQYDPAVVGLVSLSDLWDMRRDIRSSLDFSQPGIVRVTLDSPSGSVNLLPGLLVELEMNLNLGVPVGTTSLLELNPAATRAVDRQGREWNLELANAVLEVTPEPRDDDE
jgi:hypothetical protein